MLLLFKSVSLEAHNIIQEESIEITSARIKNAQLVDFLRKEVFPLAASHTSNKKSVYTYIEVRSDDVFYVYMNSGLKDKVPPLSKNEKIFCSVVDGYNVFIKTSYRCTWLVPNGRVRIPLNKDLLIVADDGYNWQLSITDKEIKIDMFYHD